MKVAINLFYKITTQGLPSLFLTWRMMIFRVLVQFPEFEGVGFFPACEIIGPFPRFLHIHVKDIFKFQKMVDFVLGI